MTSADQKLSESLLEVSGLSVEFKNKRGQWSHIVEDVSFKVPPGQAVGIVGESGSGKSVTALAILGLHAARGSRVKGSIKLAGEELIGLPEKRLQQIRGAEISMIFQDPMTSLNPLVTVGTQLTEVIRAHREGSKQAAKAEAIELLDRVGIPDPGRRVREYPHQMSGGMRQRALIAIALACRPRLLIADEPTTALDVTIQAQILDLLRELVRESGASLLMITHDLGVVAGICDEVNVMYAGKVVESASRYEFFERPVHPYTFGLLRSVPRLDLDGERRLEPIPGSPSDRISWADGCAFAPRCSRQVDACHQTAPTLEPVSATTHIARCFNPVGVNSESGGCKR